MDKQLMSILEKIENLKEQKRQLKIAEKALNAEYTRLTNQYYQIMLEIRIPYKRKK